MRWGGSSGEKKRDRVAKRVLFGILRVYHGCDVGYLSCSGRERREGGGGCCRVPGLPGMTSFYGDTVLKEKKERRGKKVLRDGVLRDR